MHHVTQKPSLFPSELLTTLNLYSELIASLYLPALGTDLRILTASLRTQHPSHCGHHHCPPFLSWHAVFRTQHSSSCTILPDPLNCQTQVPSILLMHSVAFLSSPFMVPIHSIPHAAAWTLSDEISQTYHMQQR